MRITRVVPGSDAERAGVRSGDELLAVGGKSLEDALDLTFALAWTDEGRVAFEFARGGSSFSVTLPAVGPEELGFEVQEAAIKTCGNSCVFCFVDQLPRGLRTSLYVKDEDYRLSFSYGNYVTLTNLSDADYERIAAQRLSPLYVSVHATDDAVRREMLGNKDAPPILESLRRLDRARIGVHAQAVLCAGINDGAVLEQTLADLFALGELIQSVAVVPVGLTAHRERLTRIEALSATTAAAALDTIERWQRRFLGEGRGRTVYAADELYLRAGRTLPPYDEYGDLPQLENGVGLLRSFEFDLNERAGLLGDHLDRPLALTLVTARLAEAFLTDAIDEALGRVEGLTCRIVASDNSLLGPTITVAGLLSGADMVDALKKAPESDAYLLPAAAFNEDGVTLDGMSLSEIAGGAGRENVVATDDIVGAVLDITGGAARDAAASNRSAPDNTTRGRESSGHIPSEERR
jgi:putative radical SAM enzyme (TIGR03279 family)